MASAEHRDPTPALRVAARDARDRLWPEPFPYWRGWWRRTATPRADRGVAPVDMPDASTAEPKPYQPGQHGPRLSPGEYPRDGAQILDAAAGGAGRGPAADVEACDLGDRGRGMEILGEPGGFVDEAAIMPHRRSTASVSIRRSICSGAASLVRGRRDASTTPAASVSRLRRASSGSAYLLATTSPCSVIRTRPFIVPYRLGEQGVEARPTPPPHGAATTVEQLQAQADAAPRRPPARAKPCAVPNSK